MEGNKVLACDLNGKSVKGTVKLVYNEAIASGTADYVNVTHVLVKDEDSEECYVVRPRDIHQVIEEKK